MKSIMQTLAFIAAFSATASATIVLGTRTIMDPNNTPPNPTIYEHYAWLSGEDPCASGVYVNMNSDNPCGIQFTLSNGYTYSEENCGGDNYSLLNADGSYNSACNYNTDNDHTFVCQTAGTFSIPYDSDFLKQTYVCG